MGLAARLGVVDLISAQLVSCRAQIKDKLMKHHIYIQFIASYTTSEMQGAMLRSDSLENRSCGLNTLLIHELNNSH